MCKLPPTPLRSCRSYHECQKNVSCNFFIFTSSVLFSIMFFRKCSSVLLYSHVVVFFLVIVLHIFTSFEEYYKTVMNEHWKWHSLVILSLHAWKSTIISLKWHHYSQEKSTHFRVLTHRSFRDVSILHIVCNILFF